MRHPNKTGSKKELKRLDHFFEVVQKAHQEQVIAKETVESQAVSPSPKGVSLFRSPASQLPSLAEISAASSGSSTETKSAALQKQTLVLTQGNGHKLKSTFEERAAQIHLVQLDPALDPVKIMAEAAFRFKDKQGRKLFPSKTDAQVFFETAIASLKEIHKVIHPNLLELYIEDQLKDRLEPVQMSKLVHELTIAYKSATDQLKPQDEKSVNEAGAAYESEHWPSDAYIRLAKLQLDFCARLAGTESPAIQIGSNCFDPHYLRALMLVCAAFDVVMIKEQGGWKVPPVTAQEARDFEKFYKNRFKELDGEAAAAAPKAPTPTVTPSPRSPFTRGNG